MQRLKWKPGNMLYPLPAVLISVGDINGTKNIITVAWTGTIASDPPMCSISVRPERFSYPLLKKHGSFVINLTNKRLAFATDWCGVKSGRDFDKFKEMKLTAVASQKISAPIIKESPVNIECEIKEILHCASHDMFIAQIIAVGADGSYINPKTGKFDFMKANPICYLHGAYYEVGNFIGKFGFSVEKKKKKA